MTVSELRKKLKGLKGDMPVYISDHDHGEYETNGSLGSVKVINHSNMDEMDLKSHRRDGFEIKHGDYLSLKAG